MVLKRICKQRLARTQMTSAPADLASVSESPRIATATFSWAAGRVVVNAALSAGGEADGAGAGSVNGVAVGVGARPPRRSAVLVGFGQAHRVQPAPGLALSLGGRQVQQRQRHVVQRREMRHQRIVLEHQPDMALLRRHEDTGRGVAPDLVAHLNAAAMRAHKSGQHAQHGGLAGARGAHQLSLIHI